MGPLPVLLLAPVLIWIGSGVGLLWALRVSPPTTALRLAAAFLALWSLLATTACAWVLENGGWRALTAVARSPLTLAAMFGPSAPSLWIDGALGAFVIFLVAFLLNQAVGRGILKLLDPVSIPWPEELPRPSIPVALVGSNSPAREAFAFTLLTASLRPPRIGRLEVVVLTSGLRHCLSEEEVSAVIAHELGHIRDLDGRYLTFVRTLARMMRWDPVFAYIARTLTRREELRADDEAVRATGRPLALARALYKAGVEVPAPIRTGWAIGLLGAGGLRGRQEALLRIRRLVAMAESGSPPGGPGE
jgi:Zn-dependent protease with chaperone function